MQSKKKGTDGGAAHRGGAATGRGGAITRRRGKGTGAVRGKAEMLKKGGGAITRRRGKGKS